MNEARLDQILRLGPPDEPVRARPLALPPISTEVAPLTSRTVRLRRSTRDPFIATLAAVVLLGGIAGLAGLALRVGTPSPTAVPASTAMPASGFPVSSALPGSAAPGGLIQLREFSLRTPAGWHAVMLDLSGPDGVPLVAFANFDLAGTCGPGAAAAPCIATIHLEPGEMLATLAIYPGPMDIAAVEPPTGWSARIDGMPAALQVVEEPVGTQVIGVTAQPGCDAHRAWWIGRPGEPGWIDIEACSAGADRSEFRARVDDLAASVVFVPGASSSPPSTPANP